MNESFISGLTKIVNDFKSTDSIIFDRKCCFTKIDYPIVNIQLHGFSDASLRAYKCCDYLRIDKNNVIIRCDLTSAK